MLYIKGADKEFQYAECVNIFTYSLLLKGGLLSNSLICLMVLQKLASEQLCLFIAPQKSSESYRQSL